MFEWTKVQYPDDLGISSRGLLNYLDAVKSAGVEQHSILILRHGKLACRMNFAPYDDQTPHILFSLSKTFVSAAAGFAVQEGLLNWNDKLMDLVPEIAPKNPSEWQKKITLHNLLSMGSGLSPESDAFGDANMAAHVVSCDCDHEPGTHFHYNSHGTYMVSYIVQKVTGKTVRDYLMPRLFEPLEIQMPEFDLSGEGVCWGGWGLHLSADSIARFGQCMLQKGVWNGKQVLPIEWLERATSVQISNAEGDSNPNTEWRQGYGYQIWRMQGNRFRGDGMHGQYCIVSPDDDMVVAVTAGFEDMALQLDQIQQYLFPAAKMPEATEAEKLELQERISMLRYEWPEDDGAGEYPNGTYTDGKQTIRFSDDGDTLALYIDGLEMKFGKHSVLEYKQAIGFPGHPVIRYWGEAGRKNGELTLLLRTPDGPFTCHGSIRNEAGKLKVRLYGPGTPRYHGTLEKID